MTLPFFELSFRFFSSLSITISARCIPFSLLRRCCRVMDFCFDLLDIAEPCLLARACNDSSILSFCALDSLDFSSSICGDALRAERECADGAVTRLVLHFHFYIQEDSSPFFFVRDMSRWSDRDRASSENRREYSSLGFNRSFSINPWQLRWRHAAASNNVILIDTDPTEKVPSPFRTWNVSGRQTLLRGL